MDTALAYKPNMNLSVLEPIHGKNPTKTQLITTYGLFVTAAILTIYLLDRNWRTFVLAFVAGDWAGGIAANASASVRNWWQKRPKLSKLFWLVHIVEIPLVWWLAEGTAIFSVFFLIWAAKLSVFELGQSERS